MKLKEEEEGEEEEEEDGGTLMVVFGACKTQSEKLLPCI